MALALMREGGQLEGGASFPEWKRLLVLIDGAVDQLSVLKRLFLEYVRMLATKTLVVKQQRKSV